MVPCNSIRLPRFYLWERASTSNCHICCCTTSQEVFHFRATFLSHWHSTQAFQTYEGLHNIWALSGLLLVAHFCQALFCLILPQRLRFWESAFHPQTFFILHSLPKFLAYLAYLRLRWEQDHPIQHPSLCLLS